MSLLMVAGMRVSDLLRRPIPASMEGLPWPCLVDRAAGGDLDALAAVVASRPGLAWYLVRLGSRSGVEDADAVLVEGLWLAVHARRPSPEALFCSMRSHLMRSVQRSRRWCDWSTPTDVAAFVDAMSTDGDPVADQVATRLTLDSLPPEVVRAAARKLLTSSALSPADRQRLHRWRVSPSAQLAASAA